MVYHREGTYLLPTMELSRQKERPVLMSRKFKDLNNSISGAT